MIFTHKPFFIIQIVNRLIACILCLYPGQILNHLKIIREEQNDKIFFTNFTVTMNKDLTKYIPNFHIKDCDQYFEDIVLDEMPNKRINEFLGDVIGIHNVAININHKNSFYLL